MKDISPSEMKVLERVASTVPVFQRSPGKRSVSDFPKGCFRCTHAVGPMVYDRRYQTVEISVLDGDYYENFEDHTNRVSIVVSRADSHWKRKNDSGEELSNILREAADHYSWPEIYVATRLVDSFDPEIYVRLVYDPKTMNAPKHSNSIVNVLDFLSLNDMEEVFIAIQPGRYSGVYLDPTGYITPYSEIRSKDVVAYTNGTTKRAIRDILGVESGIPLKRIRGSKPTTKNRPSSAVTFHTPGGPIEYEYDINPFHTFGEGNS